MQQQIISEKDSVFKYFVAVQEEYLEKQEALKSLRDTNDQSEKTAKTSLGPVRLEGGDAFYSRIRRSLKQKRDCDFDTKKRPKCFKATKTCWIKRGEKLSGGTIKLYRYSAKNWGDCCWLCLKKGGCHAWTYKDRTNKKRGLCYLKKKGGYRRLDASQKYVTGTIKSSMYDLNYSESSLWS